MRNFILTIAMALLLATLSGCDNFSPRQKQQIENQQGKIGEIENLANSMKAEIGSLKSQNDIQNSQLEKIQQGLVNMQSNYENSGVQILSGPGGLVVAVIGCVSLTILVLHYRSVARQNETAANILTEKVVQMNNPELEESIFNAVMNTGAEEKMVSLFRKHQLK